jgi:hypothetical protein
MKADKKNTMMIYGWLEDNNSFSVSPISGKELIHKLWTDDYAMPPKSLIFTAKTADGKKVTIIVPFSDTESSYAEISD